MDRSYGAIRNRRKLSRAKVQKILAYVQKTESKAKRAKKIFNTKPYYLIYKERYENEDGTGNR